MAGGIQRSSALFKASWSVLREDKTLLLFPILSSLASLVVIASFAIPVVTLLTTDDTLRNEVISTINETPQSSEAAAASTDPGGDASPIPEGWEIAGYIYLFAFYFVTSFVVIFFNAALIAAANERFQGRPTGVGAGLGVALKRLPQILGWTLVATTVNLILRAIEERVGLVGKIIVGLFGVGWAIAIYFAVPAVVLEGVGPIGAIKRSGQTIRKTWGESLAIAVGFGLAGIVVGILGIALLVGGGIAIAAAADGGSALGMTGGILIAVCGVVVLVGWAILSGTLRGITQTALFRYATDGTVVSGFDQHDLEVAFQRK
ncbi:MAG: hypothetical protein CMJ27_01620 [Phycisphaerae bacterium]|nr:hypothetical protein [Phycisphaerae bacterium]OUX03163.1 MAG: hypothetical protein CBD91_01060 [Phycisphaeraceae bacterium TMED231]RPH16596.1 MAG: hypothetical protein CBC49_003980 [Alphaproteobacteria bacterium TMED89]